MLRVVVALNRLLLFLYADALGRAVARLRLRVRAVDLDQHGLVNLIRKHVRDDQQIRRRVLALLLGRRIAVRLWPARDIHNGFGELVGVPTALGVIFSYALPLWRLSSQ